MNRVISDKGHPHFVLRSKQWRRKLLGGAAESHDERRVLVVPVSHLEVIEAAARRALNIHISYIQRHLVPRDTLKEL